MSKPKQPAKRGRPKGSKTSTRLSGAPSQATLQRGELSQPDLEKLLLQVRARQELAKPHVAVVPASDQPGVGPERAEDAISGDIVPEGYRKVYQVNGHEWERLPGVQYAYNYEAILEDIAKGKIPEREIFRQLVIKDPFFFVYFVMGIKQANHPFVIQCCRELGETSQEPLGCAVARLNKKLFLWAREHFKSTLITTVKVCQAILSNPEERIAIFSYSKSAAIKLLLPTKRLLEQSQFLKDLFPEVLYQEPEKEAPKWSEEVGLMVRRRSVAKENTLEAHGLIEGMPVGGHYTGRIYDDVETQEIARSPEQILKLIEAFDMSQNLGTLDGWHCLVGTTYTHMGLLQLSREKKTPDGSPSYSLSLKPATKDGTPNGQPVLLSQERLDELKQFDGFYSQQLLDPTPRVSRKLQYESIKAVPMNLIPPRLYKFMAIDPAGTNKNRPGDAWGIFVCGVVPFRNDLGASDVYILDACIEPMEHDQAMNKIVEMYTRNGKILQVGVEKAGSTTFEIHVSKALLAKGKKVTIENDRLVILRPAGRGKQDRIVSNLQWSLNNGNIYISTNVPHAYRERLRMEMDKFPFWHDDGLDALSYIFDMFKDYRFGSLPLESEKGSSEDDIWAEKKQLGSSTGWSIC